MEPGQGLKIPDLCAWESDNYIACDAAVISDVSNLDGEHDGSRSTTSKMFAMDVEECPSRHSDCGCLHMQLE